jgi:hypothetical protein
MVETHVKFVRVVMNLLIDDSRVDIEGMEDVASRYEKGFTCASPPFARASSELSRKKMRGARRYGYI